jgi:hypothetical protein
MSERFGYFRESFSLWKTNDKSLSMGRLTTPYQLWTLLLNEVTDELWICWDVEGVSCGLFQCNTVRSESRCALRLRYVHLAVSTAVTTVRTFGCQYRSCYGPYIWLSVTQLLRSVHLAVSTAVTTVRTFGCQYHSCYGTYIWLSVPQLLQSVHLAVSTAVATVRTFGCQYRSCYCTYIWLSVPLLLRSVHLAVSTTVATVRTVGWT